MLRKVYIAGLLILLVGMVASSATNLYLSPRVFTTTDSVVYLLDNTTSVSQTTLVLILSEGVSLAPSDFIVIGGGEVTSITSLNGGVVAIIEVAVAAGGTIQVTFSGDNAGGSIRLARFP